MTKTLDPDLLVACAHYLLHVEAYALASDAGELLRPQARWATYQRQCGGFIPATDPAVWVDPPMPSDDECDRVADEHLDAIARYSNALTHVPMPHVPMPHIAVCRAIVSAPRAQLEWWARTLANRSEVEP